MVFHRRGIAAPCSIRVITAYTHDLSRKPAPKRGAQRQHFEEFVRCKASLWAEILTRSELALERARELVGDEAMDLALARREGRTENAYAELCRQLAVAPSTTEVARDIVAGLEGTAATQARWLCDAVVRMRADVVALNLRLVFAVARRFLSVTVQYEDMVADGNLGLFKAVDRFDPIYGVLFSTYAVHWIRHEISRGIDDRGRTVRIPVCARIAQRKVALKRAQLEGQGHIVDDAMLAKACAIRVDRLRQLARDTAPALRLSTDYTVNDNGRDPHDGFFAPRDELVDDADNADQMLLQNEQVARLREILPQMDKKRAYILRHRFGLDGAPALTLDAIGKRLGVSRERVRQHEAAALQTLRKMLEHDHGVTAATHPQPTSPDR